MGMQVTRDHSQPDTAIAGPAGQQRAKAFHAAPNMAFDGPVPDSPELPKSDLCATVGTFSSVVFFFVLRGKLSFSGLSV